MQICVQDRGEAGFCFCFFKIIIRFIEEGTKIKTMKRKKTKEKKRGTNTATKRRKTSGCKNWLPGPFADVGVM